MGCVANRTENPETTQKSFAFAAKNGLPMHYVSASDGTNVVRLFSDAITAALRYRKDPTDVTDQILDELDSMA